MPEILKGFKAIIEVTSYAGIKRLFKKNKWVKGWFYVGQRLGNGNDSDKRLETSMMSFLWWNTFVFLKTYDMISSWAPFWAKSEIHFCKLSWAIEAERWIFWKLSINTQLYKFWHFNILSRIYIIQPANRYLLKLNRTGHKTRMILWEHIYISYIDLQFKLD